MMYEYEDHTITCSFDNEEIYFHVLNKINFKTYEDTFNTNHFNLHYTLKQIYMMMIKCFETVCEKCKIEIYIKKSDIIFNFEVMLSDIIEVDFNICIKEKISSNDVEQKQILKMKHQIEQLFDICDTTNKNLEKVVVENVLLNEKLKEKDTILEVVEIEKLKMKQMVDMYNIINNNLKKVVVENVSLNEKLKEKDKILGNSEIEKTKITKMEQQILELFDMFIVINNKSEEKKNTITKLFMMTSEMNEEIKYLKNENNNIIEDKNGENIDLYGEVDIEQLSQMTKKEKYCFFESILTREEFSYQLLENSYVEYINRMSTKQLFSRYISNGCIESMQNGDLTDKYEYYVFNGVNKTKKTNIKKIKEYMIKSFRFIAERNIISNGLNVTKNSYV
jgi:hypothetical protein